jgi:hypothetical protein|uniref:Uncharacterized protein n=1 Tax=Myoviridae sp. ctshb19 TaxID=2825194 RepID=A0A8S5UGJ0_9CAUD|nr:MAG TPA: hypothetical protein [Myoviridae sp. ctshb19]
MIELLDDPETVNSLEDDQHVLVGGVECVFNCDSVRVPNSNYVYLTTYSSRVAEYHAEVERLENEMRGLGEMECVIQMAGHCIYPDYIQNFRQTENGAAMMSREQMIDILKSGQYVLA